MTKDDFDKLFPPKGEVIEYRLEVVSLQGSGTLKEKYLKCDTRDLALDWFRHQVNTSGFDDVRFCLSIFSPDPRQGAVAEVVRKVNERDVWTVL